MMSARKLWPVVLLVAVATPRVSEARVVQMTVERTRPFAEGRSFGDAGPYVRMEGTAFFEVDPKDPQNALIVNLDKAPKNTKGMVEFRSQFVIIRPADLAKGNQKIVYGINNRGNPIELRFHQFPTTEDDPERGDGLMFRLGYTYVDAGWAGDVVTTDARLGADLPVAVQPDGRPIVSTIRVEYEEADLKGYTVAVKGNDRFRSYETADTDTIKSAFTVRDAIDGERKRIPSDAWAFGRCPTGKASLVKTTMDVCLFDGFQPHRIYDLTYPAKSPWVMGLGYAVTRDVASFLRYALGDDAGAPNPLARDATTVGIRRAYATGTSSTGMYLRDFLYLGFNEDEAHRKVFDAVRILIPGTHRLFANIEFAEPDVYSRQDERPDYVSYSHPPLTFAVTTDPISGVRDGILKRPATDPLVIQVDSANEFWQMHASLNVHDGRGKPVPVPDNVRLYSLSSHSHGGASGVAALPTAKGVCEYPTNGASSYNTVARAMLVVLDEWADRGVAPPASRYADVRSGTLVTVEEAARSFPKIPGVKFPTMANRLTLLDFGPKFTATGGWLSTLPPIRGKDYRVLVPKPDKDGLDVGGVRTVDIAVPVGTNTGWNRIAGPRSRDLCGLSGSFFPFATTKAERLASGDPRPSLEERYRNRAGFVSAVEASALDLVRQRFLLEEDAKRIIDAAARAAFSRGDIASALAGLRKSTYLSRKAHATHAPRLSRFRRHESCLSVCTESLSGGESFGAREDHGRLREASAMFPLHRLGVVSAVLAVLMMSGCGGSSTGPSASTTSAATITIVGSNGTQAFSPNPASLGGQMVVFKNNDSVTHRVVLNDGSIDTGDVVSGATSRSVMMPGSGANYHCSVHPGMIGAIGASSGAPPPACEGTYCQPY